MTTTNLGIIARLRPGLGRRLLTGLAALALYTIAAVALAAFVPETAWPPIGAGPYSVQQATIVPALNVFAAASLVLCFAAPVIPGVLQAIIGVAGAVLASAAGPLLALGESGSPEGLAAPATAALALVGTALTLALWRLHPHA
jgi:hypothetical protein